MNGIVFGLVKKNRIEIIDWEYEGGTRLKITTEGDSVRRRDKRTHVQTERACIFELQQVRVVRFRCCAHTKIESVNVTQHVINPYSVWIY